MEALQAILTRRSIRAFTPQAVDEEQIQQLMEAAMRAPSAGNQQPWQFLVITERARLDELAELLPYGKMLHQAALGIVVCGDMRLEQYKKNYWMLDCSAATQNILLAAHAIGLGAVWLGVYPVEERVKRLSATLELPEEIIPHCVIAAGYPAEEKPPSRRYKAERVHHERW